MSAQTPSPLTLIKVRFLDNKAQLPKKATDGASGYDLYAIKKMRIVPQSFTTVPIGITLEMPKGYEGQIRSRSGLAAKNGIFVLNGIGTVDSDYRGEINVILANISYDPYWIEEGDRIAQLVICKVAPVTLELHATLSDTKRGENGLGSTGR